MKGTRIIAATAALASLSVVPNALAEFLPMPGEFMVRGRGIIVAPTDNSSVVSINSAPVAGTGVGVNSDFEPEMDITWKFHKNFGVEVIAAVSSHEVRAQGGIAGLGDIIDTRVLPPTVLLQYHADPIGALRPYFGVGANYTYFFDSDVGGGLFQPGADVDLQSSWGWAAGAGMDYDLNDNWFLNFDVKYIDVDTDASFSNTTVGRVRVDVDLDPVVFGMGMGYRF